MGRILTAIAFAAAGLLALLLAAVELGWLPAESFPESLRIYLRVPAEREIAAAAHPEEAVALALEGVRADPATPYRWCALAEAYERAGDTERAARAVEQAVAMGPRLPPVLVRAANLAIRQGDTARALALYSRALDIVRNYDGVIFNIYRRTEIPIEEVLAQGLPEDGEAWRAYFRHLVQWAEPEAAARVWGELERRGFGDAAVRESYVAYLVRERRYEEAAAVWREHAAGVDPDYGQGNPIFNGGFELELGGGTFGWRVGRVEGVEVAREEPGLSGRWALRIRFNGGRNLSYRHVRQRVWLPPGSYRLEAYLKPEAISTDKGVYLAVRPVDAPGAAAARTEAVRGSGDWRKVTAGVRVPRGGLMEVAVCRDGSLRIDSKIRGAVRIDDVKLAPR